MMPYTISWYNDEHSILVVDIRGEVSWEAWHNTVDQVGRQIQTVNHRVDLIIDDHMGMPKGNPLPHLRQTLEALNRIENLDMIIATGHQRSTAVVAAMNDIASRLIQSEMKENHYLDTLEDALKLIRQHRVGNNTASTR